ncbi:MAG: hypothetical protein ABIA37_04815 [Candidatus Woesearchaeota archaeon]
MNTPELDPFSRRVISQKHFSVKNGELLVWNIPMVMFPIYTHIEMFQQLKTKYKKEFSDTIYQIAERQSILAVDFYKTKFGVKDKVQLIKALLSQSIFLGLGELKIIKLDLKTGHAFIRQDINPFAKYFQQLYGKSFDCLDDYMRGNLAGQIGRLCEKKVVCIENRCIAKGDEYCSYIIKPINEIEEEFNYQIPQERFAEAKDDLNKHKKIIASPR